MAATKSGLRAVTRVRAAIYCRISLARLGETIKVDDQERLGRKLAQQRGWEVAEVYVDNSQSAWKRNRKRVGWDKMLSDVASGLIDAIIVYHGDRLIRQPWDLELLLRLADEKGILLASPTGERRLDNPDDRFILRIEAAQACRESDNTSRRLKWHYEKAAEKGTVRLGGRGGRAFGLEADGVTIRQEDAEFAREAATRIIAGEDTGAVARDINARGARTTVGNEFTYGSLKKVLMRPRMAGLVEHHDEIIGEAAWPPILDRETWETVCAVLDNKAEQFPNVTSTRRHLLSGITTCGTCLTPLRIRHNTRPHLIGYGCTFGPCEHKVHRSQFHLDEYIINYMLGVLGNADAYRRLQPADSVDWNAKLTELRTTRQKRIDEFAGDDDADSDIIKATVRRLDARIAEVRRKIAEASAPHFLDAYWGLSRAGWDGLTLDRRRTLISRTTSITVYPSRRGPGFDESKIALESRIKSVQDTVTP